MITYCIYKLEHTDAENKISTYVGITIDISRRLTEHRRAFNGSEKASYVKMREVSSLWHEWIFGIIEEITTDDIRVAYIKERVWIKLLSNTNIHGR